MVVRFLNLDLAPRNSPQTSFWVEMMACFLNFVLVSQNPPKHGLWTPQKDHFKNQKGQKGAKLDT